MSEERFCIEHGQLRRFIQQCFIAAGIADEDAQRATEPLVWASLRGVDTHGVRNLKRYYIDCAAGVGRRDGTIIPHATAHVEMDSASISVLNANGGLGLSAASRAMDLAMEKAEQHGIGVVAVRNSTHFGAAGYYAYQATEREMLGFASTGYLFPNGQPKAVVPFGGLLPILSTNPFAMACPSGEEPAFLMDLSTSVVPVNRVEMLEEEGVPIPQGWALDEQHQVATDPQHVAKMIPLGGATEYGGHKGYALGLAGWILTGLLSGAWMQHADPTRVLGDHPEPRFGHAQEGIGHLFAAARLDHFGDPQAMRRGMDAMIRTLNDSPPAPGFEQVLVPGQKEEATLRQRLERGIPLSRSTVNDFRELADRFGIDLPLTPEQ